jgi:hypothetical protein
MSTSPGAAPPSEVPASKKTRLRSPRYPALNLADALDKAVALFKEGRHAVPLEIAAQRWGYSGKSSSVLTTTAALRAYGLLEEGRTAALAGKAQLSALGLKLAADEKGVNPDRPALLRQAALNPPIHATLWTKYKGDLPSNDLLSYQLRTEMGFTNDGAETFIRNLRASLQFADVSSGGNIEPQDGQETERQDADPGPPAGFVRVPVIEPAIATRTGATPGTYQAGGVHVPIARGEWATIVGSFPMPRAKWKRFLHMLSEMEFALVEDEPGEAKPTSESDSTA